MDYVMKKLPLLPGTYFFTVAIHDETMTRFYEYHERRYSFEVRPGPVSAREPYGIFYIPSEWEHVREEP